MRMPTEPLLALTANPETQVYSNMTPTSFYGAEIHQAAATAERFPENPENWIRLGLEYSAQHLFREAISAYAMGLSYHPFCAALYHYKGNASIRIGHFAEAAAALETASRLDMANPAVSCDLGAAYFILRDYERALKVFENGLYLNPDTETVSEIHYWYILALKAAVRSEKAAEIIRMATPVEVSCIARASQLQMLLYKNILNYDSAVHILQQSFAGDAGMYAYLLYAKAWQQARGTPPLPDMAVLQECVNQCPLSMPGAAAAEDIKYASMNDIILNRLNKANIPWL